MMGTGKTICLNSLTVETSDRRNKSLAQTRDGLDVSRSGGIVAHQVTKFADGGVNAVLRINENFTRP